MLTVYSGLAQEESRSLAESISWGKRKLAQRGIFNPSQKRYGYDYDPDGNWVINPAQAEIVRRMYHDLIAGKNTSRIAKELSDEGIETVRGNKIWSSRTIDCMIRNPIYAGRFIYQRFYVKDTLKGRAVENHGELPQYLIEDHHPAIVSPKTWAAAQLIMKNRSSKKKKPAKAHTRQEFFNIFSCSECGGPVMHTTSSRTGAHYWRCKAAEVKRASTKCGVRGFREESIEHAFMAMLSEMKKSNRLATETGKAIEDTIPSEDERIKIEEVKQEMQHFYQELYQTVEAGSKYGGDPDKIKKLTDKIVNFQNQINKLNDRKEKAVQMQKDLKWLLKELEGIREFNQEKERIEFRVDIFSRIVEKGTIFPDGTIIYDLRLGIQWTITGNDRKAWRLKMKKISCSKKM